MSMIRSVYDTQQGKQILIGHLTSLLKMNISNDIDKIAHATSDIEFLSYYHNKFVNSSRYNTFDRDKVAHQKVVYKRKFDDINELVNVKGKRMLDIGAEDRYYSQLYKNAGARMDAINIEFNMAYVGDKSNIKIYDGYNIPFESDTFDIVLIHMVLHHVIKDHELLLKDVYRVLKPGGQLIIEEHNFNDDIVNDLIDIYHFSYELIVSRKFNFQYYNEYAIRRFTYDELHDELQNMGFKEFKYSPRRGPLNKYYVVVLK